MRDADRDDDKDQGKDAGRPGRVRIGRADLRGCESESFRSERSLRKVGRPIPTVRRTKSAAVRRINGTCKQTVRPLVDFKISPLNFRITRLYIIKLCPSDK
jgi:hypothetical protein